jgi:hypothetical protein
VPFECIFEQVWGQNCRKTSIKNVVVTVTVYNKNSILSQSQLDHQKGRYFWHILVCQRCQRWREKREEGSGSQIWENLRRSPMFFIENSRHLSEVIFFRSWGPQDMARCMTFQRVFGGQKISISSLIWKGCIWIPIAVLWQQRTTENLDNCRKEGTLDHQLHIHTLSKVIMWGKPHIFA